MHVYVVTSIYNNVSSSTVFFRKKKAEKYYNEHIQLRVDRNEKLGNKLELHETELANGCNKHCFIYRETIDGTLKLMTTIQLQKEPVF